MVLCLDIHLTENMSNEDGRVRKSARSACTFTRIARIAFRWMRETEPGQLRSTPQRLGKSSFGVIRTNNVCDKICDCWGVREHAPHHEERLERARGKAYVISIRYRLLRVQDLSLLSTKMKCMFISDSLF
jgi:hypothetical protein